MRRWATCVLVLAVMLPGCLSSPDAVKDPDGAAGSADAAGSSDATLVDGPTSDSDAVVSSNTGALRLSAASMQSASISDANHVGLDLRSDFTLETWIYFETLPEDTEFVGLIGKTDFGAGTPAYSFSVKRVGSALETHLRVDGDSGRAEGTWQWSALPQTWYHLAVTYDISAAGVTNEMRAFLDGAAQGSPSAASAANNTTIDDRVAPFELGQMLGLTGTHLDGLLDEVRVWNVLRTPTEIANNCAVELLGNEAGLVGYWPMDGNADDLTSNNNDLVLRNSPTFSGSGAF